MSSMPSSTVLSLAGGGYSINSSSTNMVAYCWSEVSGFSKFGSYTGNGSSSGPTITTGFKPRWIMHKRADTTANWVITDTARGIDQFVYANDTQAELTAVRMVIQDDGFQITSTSSTTNANNGKYIYAAYADRPGNNWIPNNLVSDAGLETASKGFDVVSYTGTGSSQTIDLNFEPDMIWVKTSSHAVDHKITDTVRGLTNVLEPNQNRADSTGITQGITAVSSTGFTVGTSSDFNTSGRSYVAWCWKAGGTASSNSNGSITSSVSANTTYGFSIATYTGNGTSGATIGHGLSSAPKWMLVKRRNSTAFWEVYHASVGNDKVLYLNNTDLEASSSASWNNTDPTSSVFTVGNSSGTNSSGSTYVAIAG